MKLYRHELIIEEFYSKAQKHLWPEMKHSTEMKEIEVSHPLEVMHYLNEYKNWRNNSKHDGSAGSNTAPVLN
jgi:hypothetical protein